MKNFFVLAAAAAIALTSCKNVPVEDRIKEYEETLQMMEEKANTEYAALETDEDKHAFFEKYSEEMLVFHREVIKKNKNNILSVKALQNVYGFMEPDEVESTIATLHDTLKEQKFIAYLSKNIAAKKATAVGEKFTDFEVDGVKFSDFVGNGKFVLVDFWASWCGPCKAEIPNIKAVYEKYHGDRFDVLSIAVWDKPEATKASAEEHGIVWNQIINAQQIPTEIYGIEGIPCIMLIGPDGTILDRTMRGAQIEEVVAKALAE